jgi:hypothetical protein
MIRRKNIPAFVGWLAFIAIILAVLVFLFGDTP